MHNIESYTKWPYREDIPEKRLMAELIDKMCIIQEFVSSRQVMPVHVIVNPDPHLYPKIDLPVGSSGAIGVLTITPGGATAIAAGTTTKSVGVELAFVDHFSGSLFITGQLADVEFSATGIVTTLRATLRFTSASLIRM